MATARPKRFYAASDFRLGSRSFKAGAELSATEAAQVQRVREDLVTNDGPKARQKEVK